MAETAKKALIQPKTPKSVKPFRLGQAAKPTPPPHDLRAPVEQEVAALPLSMDRKRFTKMKRGKISPEARIDLHGMTQAQAFPALTGFILRAVSEDMRLVLVITGKGKTRPDHGPIPERHGVLRHQVPHWLQSGPLKPHVLQIAEAHLKHGGRGAYYVYLRKPR